MSAQSRKVRPVHQAPLTSHVLRAMDTWSLRLTVSIIHHVGPAMMMMMQLTTMLMNVHCAPRRIVTRVCESLQIRSTDGWMIGCPLITVPFFIATITRP